MKKTENIEMLDLVFFHVEKSGIGYDRVVKLEKRVPNTVRLRRYHGGQYFFGLTGRENVSPMIVLYVHA